MKEEILAIKYIIYRVAQEYMRFHKKEHDVNFFNECNNFNLKKCLLLPYVITIANGKKKELLDVFKNLFFPDLEEREGITVGSFIHGEFQEYTSEDIELNIVDGKLTYNFVENDFENLDSKIKNNINHSIGFIINRRYFDFANFDDSLLKQIGYDNDAFEYLKELNSIKSLNGLNKLKISERFIGLVAKFPFFISYMEEIEEAYKPIN